MATPNLPTTIRTLSQPDPKLQKVIITASPLPTLTPGSPTEHLILVHATSPCAGELLWALFAPDKMSPTIVPCYDLSGIVISSPPHSPFPAGTEIWGRTKPSHSGNAREYTIAYTEELAVRPKSVDPVSAASVPLSAITAVQALFEHGGIAGFDEGEEGRKKNMEKGLMVVNAAGGVGVWLLQLAREAGVGRIIAVCGTGNVEFVRVLGATDVVDYRKLSIRDWIEGEEGRKVDLVVDCKGGESLEQAWFGVKDTGMLLSICEPTEGRKPADCEVKDVKNYWFIMEARGKYLIDVSRLLDEGKVEPVVDSVWKLEEYEKAFEKLDGGHSRGKIILRL